MANIHGGTSGYPSVIDTASTLLSTDAVIEEHQNGPASAIVNIETELGVNPRGSSADVAARFTTLVSTVSGTAPLSSSGGTTPAISIAGSSTGYILFGDGTSWTTGYFRAGTGITIASATGGWATVTNSAAVVAPVFDRVVRTAGDITTTSLTLVDVTGATATLTTGAFPVAVGAVFTQNNSTNLAYNFYNINIDGALEFGTEGLFNSWTTSMSQNGSFAHQTAALTAAAHTIKMQWAVSAGTGTINADAANAFVFWMHEIR